MRARHSESVRFTLAPPSAAVIRYPTTPLYPRVASIPPDGSKHSLRLLLKRFAVVKAKPERADLLLLESPGSRLRALVLFGKAYPANDAPGVEIPGELALVFVARDQHDDAPIVDVLQVYGGCGTQIAREGFCGLDHHLLPDPRLWDILFRVRGPGPLPIHHSSLYFSVPVSCKGRTK